MKRRISVLLVTVIFALMSVACFSACKDNKYTVRYETDGNGTIQGLAEQKLKEGGQTSTVTATPNEGYKFLKWSDDSTQATRSDTVVDSDTTYTAYFEKLKYQVNYTAIDGGTIQGDAEQVVEYGEDATQVTATPSVGFRFVKWSDSNSENPVRCDTNIKSHILASAIFERESYDKKTLTYLTDGNGTIEGQTSQQVLMGEDGTTVKAVASDGYEFVKWSDGITTAERRELCVAESKTVTAEFKCVYATFELNYELGKAETQIKEYTFYDNNFKEEEFPVPTREHFTFGGWYLGDKQVTDTNGTMLIGKEILQQDEREIYAKWTANENYTYKILMVYVTELDATISSIRGKGNFEVYYKMSDFDIEICKTATKQLSNYLNDMLDGLVTFEIDEYFTTVPVNSDSIRYGEKVTNYIVANEIPEIYNSGIYREYQSILTVFCMNDYEYEFRTSSGAAINKYGTVYLEAVYDDSLVNNDPLENLLDLDFWRWYDNIEPFLHELIHTMEMQIYGGSLDYYHNTLSWFLQQGINDYLIADKMYLLDKVELNGKKVGIPIEFWRGEIDLFMPEDW